MTAGARFTSTHDMQDRGRIHAVIVELAKCAQPWACVRVSAINQAETRTAPHTSYTVCLMDFLLQGSSRSALSNPNLLKPKHKGFPWVGSEKDLKL